MCWCIFHDWGFKKSQSRSAVEELHQQIDWYHCASARARLYYSLAKGTELLAATAIPILAISGVTDANLKIWAAILGSIVTLSAAWQSVCQWHSKWVSWRSTWQDLISERILFQEKGGPYEKEAEPDKVLAKNLCAILKREFSEWRENRNSTVTVGNTGTRSTSGIPADHGTIQLAATNPAAPR